MCEADQPQIVDSRPNQGTNAPQHELQNPPYLAHKLVRRTTPSSAISTRRTTAGHPHQTSTIHTTIEADISTLRSYNISREKDSCLSVPSKGSSDRRAKETATSFLLHNIVIRRQHESNAFAH